MNRGPAAVLDCDDPGETRPVVQVQLLHVPGCPLVDRVNGTLRSGLSKVNVRVTIEELEGPYASPTLLIDGIEVTGRTPAPGVSCRLDLPTEEQVLVALAAASVREPAP